MDTMFYYHGGENGGLREEEGGKGELCMFKRKVQSESWL